MTPDQSTRLWALLPAMRENARFKVSPNEFNRARSQCDALRDFLNGAGDSTATAEEWLAYAEQEAQPPAEKVVRCLTIEQILTGMAPEHFAKET